MAKPRWIGAALAVAQVNTWTFAGTWLTTETVTITIGSKVLTVVVGSATIATIMTTLEAALDARSEGEFTEITWSSTATTIVATAVTAGVPFTVTISTNSVGGTINGAASSTGTATVACSGPNFWNVNQNWSTGAKPATGDDVSIENSSVSILYGLANAAELLNSLSIAMSFTGTIGLPKTNITGNYSEYRDDYLKIGMQGTFAVTIGTGEQGNGSGRIKIDFGSTQANVVALNCGSSVEQGIEAVLLKGTNTSNSFTFKGGRVTAAIAAFADEVANAVTLITDGSKVRCGVGVTFTASTDVQCVGGSLDLNSAIGAGGIVTCENQGLLRIFGAGTIPTLNATGGTVDHQGTGTITNLNVGNSAASAVFSRQNDSRPLTVTNATLYPNGSILDPTQAITFTNKIGWASNTRQLLAT